jgi:tripartite-type tricarboxylate transporter receptor subunit TctC
VSSKRLKVLAVGTAKPLPEFPGVPTMGQVGYPGFEKTAPWLGLLAPAGTAPDVIARLNQAVTAALKDPKVRQRMHELGAVVVGGTPQEFHDYLVADQKRWANVIKAAGIKME